MNEVDGTGELFLKSVQFHRAYESFVICAAHDLKIFGHIPAHGATAAEIATSLGIPEVGTSLLMNCLVTSGILQREGDKYTVLRRFQAALSPANAEVAEMLAVCSDQCRMWTNAAEIIKCRRALGDIRTRFDRNAAWTSQYQQRVEAKNRAHAEAMGEQLAGKVRMARSVIDIGGGHGYYSKVLLRLNPELKVTIYDLKSAIDYSRERLRRDCDFERICFQVGDARTLAAEGEFDVAILSDLLHYFGDEEKTQVLGRALKCLRPGGLLVVSKFRLGTDGSEPRFSAFFALQKHLENPNGGYLETDQETGELLRNEGAEEVTIVPLNEEKTLVVGRRASAAQPPLGPTED
jgi:SAM-dependent methyltransferase